MKNLALSMTVLVGSMFLHGCGTEEAIDKYKKDEEIAQLKKDLEHEKKKKELEQQVTEASTAAPETTDSIDVENQDDQTSQKTIQKDSNTVSKRNNTTSVTVIVKVEVYGEIETRSCTGLCPGMTDKQVLKFLGMPYKIDSDYDLWYYDGEVCVKGRKSCSLEFSNGILSQQDNISVELLDITTW